MWPLWPKLEFANEQNFFPAGIPHWPGSPRFLPVVNLMDAWSDGIMWCAQWQLSSMTAWGVAVAVVVAVAVAVAVAVVLSIPEGCLSSYATPS